MKNQKYLEKLKTIENMMLPEEREKAYSIIKEMSDYEMRLESIQSKYEENQKEYQEKINKAEQLYKELLDKIYNDKENKTVKITLEEAKVHTQIQKKEKEITELYKEIYIKLQQQKETGTINKEEQKYDINEDDDFIVFAVPKE